LKRLSRSDQTGDQSNSVDRSNNAGIAPKSPEPGVGIRFRRNCASLNSRTLFGAMAWPAGKSAKRRFALISSPWKIPE
jgi:hypothetical protein